MKIEKYAAERRSDEALRLLLQTQCEERVGDGVGRMILLPIPTTRDGVNINGTDLALSSIICEVGCGDLIVGYDIPLGIVEDIRSKGARVLDVSGDEAFLSENAEISAIGALGYILNTTPTVPSGLYVGVIGYGRIGSLLVRYLLFFGARVRVYTGRECVRRELSEYGVSTAPIDYKSASADFSGLDIIINTAPQGLSSLFPLGRVTPPKRVIDLASGDSFMGVEGVERLPGIPGKMYPKSAGRAYYKAIISHLSGEGGQA